MALNTGPFSLPSVVDDLPAVLEAIKAIARKIETEFESREVQDVAYVNTVGAGVEQPVPHDFGRRPSKAYLVAQDRSGSVYTGDTAWNSTTIYIKCDSADLHGTLRIER